MLTIIGCTIDDDFKSCKGCPFEDNPKECRNQRNQFGAEILVGEICADE